MRETDAGDESGNVVVDEEHYKLIIDCNTLTVDIDNEIVVVHNFIRDKYRAKFPELEVCMGTLVATNATKRLSGLSADKPLPSTCSRLF